MKTLTLAYQCDNCEYVHRDEYSIYFCQHCKVEVCSNCIGIRFNEGRLNATSFCPKCKADLTSVKCFEI